MNNFKSIQFRPNNQVLFACLIIEGEGGGGGGGKGSQIAKLHFLEILAPTAFVALNPKI